MTIGSIVPDSRWGGMNTWHQAFSHPDRWAAVLIQHGAPGNPSMDSPVLANAAHIPFKIATGEDDKLSRPKLNQVMADSLTKAGIHVEVEIKPGVGHQPVGYEEDIEWMLQFTRKRPATFSFVAPESWLAGTRGITMERPGPMARFTCRNEGSTITLE